MKIYNKIGIFTLCLLWAFAPEAHCQKKESPKARIIGEVFGRQVAEDEFVYYLKTASIFTRLGAESRTEEDTRAEAWQNLIFLQEANKDGITIEENVLKDEIKRLVKEKAVEYQSKEYAKWVSMSFNEDVKTFERRIEDLLKVNTFLKIKTNPQVTIPDEELKQKYLNQNNSFESEYIRFESEDEARRFIEEVKKNPFLWKETFDKKKAEGQKGAAWINVMSLEALIDLWKIPKEDAYRILSHKEGDFIIAKFYYGSAVFRLLYKREVGEEKFDEKEKKNLRDMLTAYKKQYLVKEYFNDLFKRANYKDYVMEAKHAAKLEELKKKSNILLKTNQGDIEVMLFPDIAPKACENFIGLAEKGFYDGLIFHRVIKDFMIQGGDPSGTGEGGDSIWRRAFEDEVSEKVQFDRPGLLAMANSGPNTNKSQFFITTVATPWLNNKHTIFGEVVSGLAVVKKIENAPTDSNNKPKEAQKILKIVVKK
ncbi:MAG: peptidylprolyl isomerase [Candidatus Omnitrophota bacterium]